MYCILVAVNGVNTVKVYVEIIWTLMKYFTII